MPREGGVGALRVYFRWAQRTGRRADNPTELLDPVRTPPPAPRPVPEDALAQALAQADDEVRLMVLLAAYGGLRRAEVAGLRREDLEDDLLHVTGKGSKTRVIPIGGALGHARKHVDADPGVSGAVDSDNFAVQTIAISADPGL